MQKPWFYCETEIVLYLMNGRDYWSLVANEHVEFEKYPIEVEDFRHITSSSDESAYAQHNLQHCFLKLK